jgi:hypothetical protein
VADEHHQHHHDHDHHDHEHAPPHAPPHAPTHQHHSEPTPDRRHEHAPPPSDHRHVHLSDAPRSADPYPFIYSKDACDQRRFMLPGQGYGPARNALSRGAMLMTWTIFAGVGALIIFAIIMELAGHPHP